MSKSPAILASWKRGAVTWVRAWFLVRFIHRFAQEVARRPTPAGEQPLDLTTLDALSKLARLVVLIVAVVMAAHTWGFQVGGLLALGGVGGLVLGFAAKDPLANFFGGQTIYLIGCSRSGTGSGRPTRRSKVRSRPSPPTSARCCRGIRRSTPQHR
jgi:small-conductance mechanosensitive channel